MAENQQQQMDHYDFINAPQFVDFSDLAAQDDPDADKFFETHREEDDFLLPLDINAISPTVQLLYDNGDYENQHYSNEANKAAMAAGLEDVKIEYYASPQQQSSGLSQPSSANKKKSVTSVYGTPNGGTSGLSSATSFYTPTGDAEDKENLTPLKSIPSSLTKNESFTIKSGKSSEKQEKNQRNVLADYIISSSQPITPSYTSPRDVTIIKKTSSGSSAAAAATHSLMSRLNELSLVSSDEEQYADEDNQPKLQTSQSVADKENSPTPAESTYSTFNVGKMEFFSIPQASEVLTAGPVETNDSYMSESGDVTLVVQGSSNEVAGLVEELEPGSESESDDQSEDIGSMELGAHINSILRKLDAELYLDDQEEEDPRCSILVAPKVGQQVHWNAVEEIAPENQYNEKVELNVSYEVGVGDGEGVQNDIATTDDILDFYGLGELSGPTVYQVGRASSVGDLAHAVEFEPKTRQFETYGYNPRHGITIPKTPDVSGRDEVGQMHAHNNYNSNKNACYFEIEAPKPSTHRRVSSCSDLINLQKKAKLGVSRYKAPKVPPKKPLTVPRTPDTMKRYQKPQIAQNCTSNASSAGSTSSKYNATSFRSSRTTAGPSVADRLAAAKSRAPMKGNHYVSMAEAMINYQKNTPDRFRSLPKGRVVPERRPTSCDSRRRVADPSPARSEESEGVPTSRPRSRANSISDKRTNARNVAPSASGPVLPKKAEFKPTIPRPFNFRSGHRTRPATAADVVDFKFKARPVPSKLLNDTVAIGSSKFKTLTQPMSPHFASDARLRERQEKRTQEKLPAGKPTNTVKSAGVPKSSRIPTTGPSTQRNPHLKFAPTKK